MARWPCISCFTCLHRHHSVKSANTTPSCSPTACIEHADHRCFIPCAAAGLWGAPGVRTTLCCIAMNSQNLCSSSQDASLLAAAALLLCPLRLLLNAADKSTHTNMAALAGTKGMPALLRPPAGRLSSSLQRLTITAIACNMTAPAAAGAGRLLSHTHAVV